MRGRALNLAGFRVRVDASWLIIAFLVTWTLAAGVFPNRYPCMSGVQYWSMGIICAAGLLVSIVLHELCHSLVARRYGMPIGGITLFVFGGMAHMRSEPPGPGAEAKMAVAGPAASIVIGLTLLGARELMGAGVPTFMAGIVRYLGFINLALAGFNLVPAFPLDGGRILRAGLWAWKGDLRRATKTASTAGKVFGYALIGLGMLALLAGGFIAGIWWGLIGLFIAGAARGSYRQMLLRRELEGEPVSRFMSRDPITVRAGMTVEELIDDYVLRYYKKLYPVTEEGRLVGCVSVDRVKDVDGERRGELRVSDVMEGCDGYTVAPDEDAAEALSMMSGRGSGRLIVAEDGRPVGMVSLRDMLELLSMKIDLGDRGR